MPETSSDRPGRSVLIGLESHIDRNLEDVAAELEQFIALLVRWQKIQNLVSRETMPFLWTRHVRDSLQLIGEVRVGERAVLDLGSGGGFPAIPVAIALKERGMCYHLVESNKRKASFLRTVARELELPIQVHGERMELLDEKDIGKVDLVTSRATASLVTIFALVSPFWGSRTRGLFHKGREVGEELVKARADWSFDVLELASETDHDGRILEISGLKARTQRELL